MKNLHLSQIHTNPPNYLTFDFTLYSIEKTPIKVHGINITYN